MAASSAARVLDLEEYRKRRQERADRHAISPPSSLSPSMGYPTSKAMSAVAGSGAEAGAFTPPGALGRVPVYVWVLVCW